MANKKAVLVGINKYLEPGNDLRGCIYDVENMYDILTKLYKFDPDNIRIVLDKRATKQAILERLDWLVQNNQVGDELLFQYSGHGSQIRDREGDELEDGLDEILCPTDLNWDDPLKDDDLANLFVKIPDGITLTMISDSCHSGSISREFTAPNSCGADYASNYNKARFIPPPFDIAARALDRELPIQIIGSKGAIEYPQKHVLISGCRDDQTSSDAYIGGKYQGAMTCALTTAIRSNSTLNYNQAITIVRATLEQARFTQVPQLSGNETNLNRPLFGGR